MAADHLEGAFAFAFEARRAPNRRRSVGLLVGAGGVLAAGFLADLPTAAGTRAVAAPAARVQACTIAWSEPDTLRTAAGRLVMVDAPEIAPWGNRWAMVGRLALETNTLGQIIRIPGAPHEYQRAGFLLREDEIVDPIPAPEVEALASPRVASAFDDRAMLVWGRPGAMESIVDEVWSAEYDGTAWSSMQRVVAGTQLHWSPTFHSRMIVAGEELRLVAAATELKRDSGAVLLRWSGGRWTTVPLRMPWARYTQLAEGSGDSLLITYVAPASPHGNSLFAQRFDLSGSPLGERVRLSPTDGGVVHDQRIVTAGDSMVHVVWPGWPSPSAGAGASQTLPRMYIARSADQGRTWTVNEGPPVNLGQPSALTAMTDAGGAVHVSTRVYHGSVSWPAHLTWWLGAWHVSEPPRVPDAALVGAPVVIPLANDSLRMIWNIDRLSDRVGGVVTTPGMMLSSRGAMTCAREQAPGSSTTRTR